jgi:hypothetical protein
MDTPVSQNPTCLPACYNPAYGPVIAISSVHLRFHKELRCRCRLDVQLGQTDDICCSVKDNVSRQRAVPLALSPQIQLAFLPVFQPPTHPKVHKINSYSPQMAVSLKTRDLTTPMAPKRPCRGSMFPMHISVHVEFGRGGVRDKGNERRWMFIREQQCGFDALASNGGSRTLKNDERHWTFVQEGHRALHTSEGEKGPCSENQDTEGNPMRLRQVPDLESSIVHGTMNENISGR